MNKNLFPIFRLFLAVVALFAVAGQAHAATTTPTVYMSSVSVPVGGVATGSVYVTESLPGVTNYYTGTVSVNSAFAQIVDVTFDQSLIANLSCKTSVIFHRKNKSEVIFSASCRRSIMGSGVLAKITYKGVNNTGRSRQLITPSAFVFNKVSAPSVPGTIQVTGFSPSPSPQPRNM